MCVEGRFYTRCYLMFYEHGVFGWIIWVGRSDLKCTFKREMHVNEVFVLSQGYLALESLQSMVYQPYCLVAIECRRSLCIEVE